jgi:hypothetical protein
MIQAIGCRLAVHPYKERLPLNVRHLFVSATWQLSHLLFYAAALLPGEIA